VGGVGDQADRSALDAQVLASCGASMLIAMAAAIAPDRRLKSLWMRSSLIDWNRSPSRHASSSSQTNSSSLQP
jgi:hypothetical protein